MRRAGTTTAIVLLACAVVALAGLLLWARIVRLLALVGVIALAYLAIRLLLSSRSGRRELECSGCGRRIEPDARICPHCFALPEPR